MSKKIFSKKLNYKLRLSYILNLILFICITLIIISGVLISKTILTNISSQNRIWKVIHIGVPNITLCLIGIHIGLHWNWIMNMSKKVFKLNLPKKFSRVISMFLVVVILIFGCYNIYSKRFIQKSVISFTTSQNVHNGHSGRMKNREVRPRLHRNNITEEEFNKLKEERKNTSGEDFEKIKGNHSKGKLLGNNINITSIVMMAINYLSICGVFTIITYYIDKKIRNLHLNNSKNSCDRYI